MQTGQDGVGVVDQNRLSELEFEQRGREIKLGQYLGDTLGKIGLPELQRGYIYGNRQFEALGTPLRALTHGFAQDPVTDADNNAGFLGNGNEVASFYRVTRSRLDQDLNGLTGYLGTHFAVMTGEGRNFYLESIERNLEYLTRLICEERDRRFDMLKRGGVVEQVIDEQAALLK